MHDSEEVRQEVLVGWLPESLVAIAYLLSSGVVTRPSYYYAHIKSFSPVASTQTIDGFSLVVVIV